jgi:hypothetical protein
MNNPNIAQSYCGHCGTPNNTGFKYCTSCGYELKRPAESSPYVPQQFLSVHPASSEVVCSKCHSSQLSANQKGYNSNAALLGKHIGGVNEIGLGMAGSGDILITCLSCGHKFKPGDGTLKIVDELGDIRFEKQRFVDKEGERWRTNSLIGLIALILLILLAIWFIRGLVPV